MYSCSASCGQFPETIRSEKCPYSTTVPRKCGEKNAFLFGGLCKQQHTIFDFLSMERVLGCPQIFVIEKRQFLKVPASPMYSKFTFLARSLTGNFTHVTTTIGTSFFFELLIRHLRSPSVYASERPAPPFHLTPHCYGIIDSHLNGNSIKQHSQMKYQKLRGRHSQQSW